ncbi:ABC transporter permease [Longirhabdus pacifica]|uniref:ABC transporter permease n=1 Tax=Longirhabdus pacifica TaxID=2305227 RepID=UPI001009039D|nr:ABC transporter permease subunit [Longirhabdus pacifica]
MWQKIKPYVYVLPAVLMLVMLFLGGILQGLLQSVGVYVASSTYSLSFEAYRSVLLSEDFWNSLTYSLTIASTSTIVSMWIGTMMAFATYYLSLRVSGGTKIKSVIRLQQLPLLLPHIAVAYMFFLLFTQSGWISRLSYSLGWIEQIDQFPILVHDPYGWSIIFTYVWKEVPFIFLLVYPVLLRLEPSWMQMARVHGASIRQYFFTIFSLLLPSVLTSGYIVFAFTFTAFEVPYLLGVTYPKHIAVLSYQYYSSGGFDFREEALAVNILLVIITAVLGLLILRSLKKLQWHVRGARW